MDSTRLALVVVALSLDVIGRIAPRGEGKTRADGRGLLPTDGAAPGLRRADRSRGPRTPAGQPAVRGAGRSLGTEPVWKPMCHDVFRHQRLDLAAAGK